MILRGIAILLFLLNITTSYGQSHVTKAFAVLDTGFMEIGDQITLHLGVDHSDKERVLNITPEVPLDTTIFEILNRGKWEAGGHGRLPGMHRDITFTAWDTGIFRIPVVTFIVQFADSRKGTFQSQPLLLTVNNPKNVDEMEDIAPIKGIIPEKRAWEDIMPWVIGTVVILGLGFVMWSFYKKMTAQPVAPVVQKIIYPPYVIAERLLNELKAKKLWQKGEIKDYYSELSHILRGYLEEQFKIPALESTTDELVYTLNNNSFQDDVIDKMEGLLQTADLVKFAKLTPPDSVHDTFWLDALQVVQKTKPQLIEATVNQEVANKN